MIPGMGGRGGLNPKKLNAMMKQMGISLEDIDNVEEVIIRTPTKEYVFSEAEVSVMTAQGQKTYQVVGEPTIRDLRSGAPAQSGPIPAPAPLFTEEDVKLVAEQANVTPEKAREALKEANGQPAEAIIKLLEG